MFSLILSFFHYTHLLSIDKTKILLCAFVLPKFNYCNSLLYGSRIYVMECHQKVQDSAARHIYQRCRQNHIYPSRYLHWLPINARIEYKLSAICHSFFLGLSPIYLSDLLSVSTPKRNLRSSSDSIMLCIPKLRTKTFGHRTFIFADLQYGIRCLQNSDILILFTNLSMR